MKIQATDIQAGDLICAYCNNKMQVCKAKNILEDDLNTITLFVFPSRTFYKLNSRVVRFQRVATVELYTNELNTSNNIDSY